MPVPHSQTSVRLFAVLLLLRAARRAPAQAPHDDIPVLLARKEVDDAIRDGEAAFARSHLPAATAAYQRALELDPKAYVAALFTGHILRHNEPDG